MRGWIGLAIIGGIIYYYATETDKLDEPINYVTNIFTSAERKVDSMTGTKIQRIDKRIPELKSEMSNRLTTEEMTEIDAILKDTYSLEDFRGEYCQSTRTTHPVFSRDNLRYICDRI